MNYVLQEAVKLSSNYRSALRKMTGVTQYLNVTGTSETVAGSLHRGFASQEVPVEEIWKCQSRELRKS